MVVSCGEWETPITVCVCVLYFEFALAMKLGREFMDISKRFVVLFPKAVGIARAIWLDSNKSEKLF